jgi:demethylmenaquinone methyltransferase/2-methoxy-6-polyprenyl-1,4-benzoquinol methylase
LWKRAIDGCSLVTPEGLVTSLLDKRDERIRRMFGQIAPWYDTLNHLLSLNIDKRWRRKTVQLVPPRNDGPILDLCTGTGDLALEYRKKAPATVNIIGADFCPEMLARAHAKVAGIDGIAFQEADAQSLPFGDNEFQIVSVAFGLRNVCDYKRGLAEMIRVCKPGGRVAILEFSKPSHPILGRLYRWYFRYLLPCVGQLLCRNRESAYKYLPESVLKFPDGDALAAKLRDGGLKNVAYTPLTFGIATLYVGEKA